MIRIIHTASCPTRGARLPLLVLLALSGLGMAVEPVLAFGPGQDIVLPRVSPIVVTIEADGTTRVEAEHVEDPASLERRIGVAAGDYVDASGRCLLPVLLRCDARADFAHVDTVLKSCFARGIREIRIAVAIGEEETALETRLADRPGSRTTDDWYEILLRRKNDATEIWVSRKLVETIREGGDPSTSRLRETLRECRERAPEALYVVRAKAGVRYGDVIATIELLSRGGLERIVFDPQVHFQAIEKFGRGSDQRDRLRREREKAPGGARVSIDAALRWLAAHQSPDGSWDADGFHERCAKAKGQPCDGAGYPLYDVGLTGLALLAFLGDGHTHDYGPHKKTVKQALMFLRKQQDAEGCFGPRAAENFTYGHALATQAMARAYGLTHSPLFLRQAQRGIDFALACRNPYKAWRYGMKPGDNDSSVTSLMLMALIAGERAGLKVDAQAMRQARGFLLEVTDDRGHVGYHMRGIGPVRPVGREETYPEVRSESLTAAALLCRILMGESLDEDESLRLGVSRCLAKPPVWETPALDFYYWYYGSWAMAQIDDHATGESWRTHLLEAILPAQRDGESCAAGSWDPVDAWGGEGGRVYSTALLAMALEAPYAIARR